MALFGNKTTDKDSKKAAAATPTKTVKKEAVKKEVVSMQDLYSGKTPAGKSSGSKTVTTAGKLALAQQVLVKPIITEKATNLVTANKYVFMVAAGANKISIAQAVSAIYGVKPVAVNIINRQGKKVARGKVRGQRSDSKKAVVTLKKGETIKIYEGV